MIHDSTHTEVEVCGEQVCATCYEQELMLGKPQLAPRRANEKLVKIYIDKHSPKGREMQAERAKNV